MSDVSFYTINLQKGIDKTISFSFYEDMACNCGCAPNDDNPINLAGKKVLCVIRQLVSNKEIDRLTTENGRIKLGVFDANKKLVESEAPDSMSLYFPHDITEAYDCNKAAYDLILIDVDDEGTEFRECVLTGNVLINKGVAYVL